MLGRLLFAWSGLQAQAASEGLPTLRLLPVVFAFDYQPWEAFTVVKVCLLALPIERPCVMIIGQNVTEVHGILFRIECSFDRSDYVSKSWFARRRDVENHFCPAVTCGITRCKLCQRQAADFKRTMKNKPLNDDDNTGISKMAKRPLDIIGDAELWSLFRGYKITRHDARRSDSINAVDARN